MASDCAVDTARSAAICSPSSSTPRSPPTTTAVNANCGPPRPTARSPAASAPNGARTCSPPSAPSSAPHSDAEWTPIRRSKPPYTAAQRSNRVEQIRPKCQGAAARTWLAEREADLLPVGYFHVVFTLPAEVAAIAFQNKALVYDLLFRAASETMLTIAADPKHLGARIGITAVLHTWGSALTHHPHVHMIVPGGGIAPDGTRWISSRPVFLLPVRVLGQLF